MTGRLPGETAGRSLSFDRIASEYDATRGGEERGARHAALIAPLLDPAHPVLDLGAGTGAVSLGLRRAGFRVLGVDLSPAMLSHARRRLGPVVVNADASCLPLRDGSVAQACSVWLLHLVGDLVSVAAEVRRVLRDDGRWVVVPAGGDVIDELDPISVITIPMARRLHGEGMVTSRPSLDRLGEVAGRAGLVVSEVVDTPTARYAETPAEAADKLERRIYSFLWNLDENTFTAQVAPVIAALRALPDPDVAVRRSTATEHLVVLRPV